MPLEEVGALRLNRAADRSKLAVALESVAARYGATVERREGRAWAPREIYMTISLGGADAHIGIDGDSRVFVPIISWVIRGQVGKCFGGCFPQIAYAGPASATPHYKATSIAGDCEDLIHALDGGLFCITQGSAFQYYVHPWAADTAWVACGSPDNKQQWIADYRRTGEHPAWDVERAAERRAAIIAAATPEQRAFAECIAA